MKFVNQIFKKEPDMAELNRQQIHDEITRNLKLVELTGAPFSEEVLPVTAQKRDLEKQLDAVKSRLETVLKNIAFPPETISKRNGGQDRQRMINKIIAKKSFMVDFDIGDDKLIDQIHLTHLDPSDHHWELDGLSESQLSQTLEEMCNQEIKIGRCASDDLCFDLIHLMKACPDAILLEIVKGDEDEFRKISDNRSKISF